ncbi:MAG TPA: phage virion morphogenesis protein [Acidobacteria bacterium]|nr:phage virion morphogenesis protein [Acidobacteriota bacterium]
MITIEIDDHEIQAALRRLQRQIGDLTPAMQEIGEYLVQSTKDRFARAEDPEGNPWPALSPVTIERKGHDKPLVGESKRLSSEIFVRPDRDSVEVGSALEYAAVQQFGARKGEFGTDRHGRPIPWGDISKRPFIGLSNDDRAEILDIIEEYLARAIGG